MFKLLYSTSASVHFINFLSHVDSTVPPWMSVSIRSKNKFYKSAINENFECIVKRKLEIICSDYKVE